MKVCIRCKQRKKNQEFECFGGDSLICEKCRIFQKQEGEKDD